MTRDARGRCVLCGAADLTEEHVLGEWTKKYLPTLGHYELLRHGRGATHRKTAGQLAMLRPRILCRSCNERLGREVEDKAEGARLGMMLRPSDGSQRYRLSPREQRAIATWAAKVALFEPYMRIPRGDAQPRDLADFNTHLRPPRTFGVWLGAHGGTGSVYSSFLHGDATITTTLRDPPRVYVGEVLTFHIGHVVLQVFKAHTTRPHTVQSPDPLGGALLRIWPPRRAAIVWPPPHFTPLTYPIVAGTVPLP